MAAADKVYTFGNKEAAASRADLGLAMGRWIEEARNEYVALQAFGSLEVAGHGMISFLGAGWAFDADAANKSGLRPMQGPFPTLDPETRDTYNVILHDRGFTQGWDETDPNLAVLGEVGVELQNSMRSYMLLLQSIEYACGSALGVVTGSNPFSATDVDASGAYWSESTTDCSAHVQTGLVNYGGALDSVYYTWKARNNLAGNEVACQRFGGLSGVGRLSDEQLAGFWGSFGIRNQFVTHTTASGLGSDVILYRRGTGDPMSSHCGIVLPYKRQFDSDQVGVSYRRWDSEEGRSHYVVAFREMTKSPIMDINGGVRILDTHA